MLYTDRIKRKEPVGLGSMLKRNIYGNSPENEPLETSCDGWRHISEVAAEVLNDWQTLPYVPPMDYGADYFKKLGILKAYYNAYEERILKHHYKYFYTLYSKYPYSWMLLLNEVEMLAWNKMCEKGYLPLYPQYPVLNYYLDFGNPALKIGFEIDGKEFHNKERDIIRDTELKKEGWRIIRVSGTEMMRTNFIDEYNFSDDGRYFDCSEFEDNVKHWMLNTGDGVLEAIKVKFFRGKMYYPEGYGEFMMDLVNKTLENHSLIH